MSRKPATVAYGLDDTPPLRLLVVLASQHALLALMFVVYPIVAAAGAGLDFDRTRSLLTATALALGIGTIVQCWPRAGGSGLLLPHLPNGVMLPAAIHALTLGGPAMLAGLGLASALIQLGFSRCTRALRLLFPPEVCGVAVMMLGVSLAAPALHRMIGPDGDAAALDPRVVAVGLTTLAVIAALAVSSRGAVRFFAVLVGAAVGWIVAAVVALPGDAARGTLASLPLVALPIPHWPGLAFDAALLPVVTIGAIITAIDTLGTVVSVQRMNDVDWRRPDMASATRGVRAVAVSDVFGALAGAFPSGTSSSNVGLAFATSATAWRIGVAAGLAMIAAAFSPRLIGALTLVPGPVVGAIVAYSAAYLIVSGMDLVLSRRLSERRIFVVGLSILAGLAVPLFPRLVASVPEWLDPVVASPLSVSALAAVALNVVFRIGIRRQAAITVTSRDRPFTAVQEFLEAQGDLWGARREVVATAIHATAQAVETLFDTGLAPGRLELRAHYDETMLDVMLVYEGASLEVPAERPNADDLLGDARAVARFVGYLLSRSADRLVVGTAGGAQTLSLRFES